MTTLGVNALFSAGSDLLGIRNDPYAAFNFFVEIEGLVIGGFTEVTGLEVETETHEFREGGVNEYVHKLPGPTRNPSNLVLKHGLTDIESLWSWHQDVTRGEIERKNGTIYLLDRMRLPAMWWDFTEAFPIKWTGPQFNAESNLVGFESVELVHRGISKPAASSLVSSLRGVVSAGVDIF